MKVFIIIDRNDVLLVVGVDENVVKEYHFYNYRIDIDEEDLELEELSKGSFFLQENKFG
ncbi:hypothetical protein [Bacillus cereus]|uniref:hypothetical protein n=1 Tax=Bacillus cereus TaxID=1396 RepID=UPI00039FD24A|nr:hypothetical protein [Bacillus cereus]